MALKPVADRVIVKYFETEDKTASGIVLPESSKEKTQQAEVVLSECDSPALHGQLHDFRLCPAAPGKEVPVQVKPGDRVIYGKYTGTEIKYEGEKYLVINADDIIAIVKD